MTKYPFMKKLLTVQVILFLYTTSVLAQKSSSLLDQWSARSPIEKVYLHFDRGSYVAGETAWFKAYLYSDGQPDTISTTIYVELLNDSTTVLSRVVLPIFMGSATGQIELPTQLSSGIYVVRAYTATMLNQAPGETDLQAALIYQRPFQVLGKPPSIVAKQKDPRTRIEFFPEGGNFVSGLNNSLAFKITNECGMPVKRDGYIQNDKGEKMVEFKTYHDGMGVFDLLPEDGHTYYAILNGDVAGVKYPLPLAAKNGIVFRIVPDDKGSFYEIFLPASWEKKKPAYLTGQMQHHVLFNHSLPTGQVEWSGIIDSRLSPSGIMQVTVFDEDDLPLAERLVFVDNKEYLHKAVLSIDTLSFASKSKNQFTLAFNDSLSGNFSAAITDADYDICETSTETIVSGLLLTADLKGYIHNPAYYFTSTNDSVKNALDLLMMVNGWRRFTWTKLKNTPSKPLVYKDEGYITLAGKVLIRDTKKILPDYILAVLQTAPDSTQNSFELMETDKDGRFRMDSLVFTGRNKFVVSDMKGYKSKWLDILPDADSLEKAYPLAPVAPVLFERENYPDYNTVADKLAFDFDAISRENGKLLEGITLKVKKKTPLQELEEKYVSGLFSGMTQKTIDLVNVKEKIYQRNIFDYIQGRVNGIDVFKNGFNYTLYYRQNFSLSTGRIPMQIYLNEMPVDPGIIATIPADQIAMLKVYSSFVGASNNGNGGVLAIYTKKGGDLTSLQMAADIFSYKGYSVTRDFYSPDYSVDISATAKPDHRITLHWQPFILLNEADAKIPLVFYNNDRTKRYKVIAEGITWDGKMVHLEKIITPGHIQ